jgi:hypothetical protein
MRSLLLLITIIISFNGMARERVPSRCEESAAQISKIDLMFFNTKEVIKHGECVGIELAKRGFMRELPKACDEVVENENNLLGPLELSKKEALQIGQCVGIINYIYDHYHGEEYQSEHDNNYYSKRRNNIYQCEKGMTAVKILTATESSLSSRSKIRDVLCEAQRERY